MFRKILVANRGEIAVRVLRACRELGLSTVAIFSEVDRDALHVRYADEAYPIGPAPATESYLCIDKIVDVARRAQADAIHPGYGFLAENPGLAIACQGAGIGFIGPSPECISLMGDKIAARRRAQEAGVTVIPGSYRPLDELSQGRILELAEEIGYPLLVKAVAGGGGKGMRLARSPQELATAIPLARREAKASFGNDALYLERLIEEARHIEFQILADNHGNMIHLGERECSIQRRHQKLIEEAPSLTLDEPLRQKIGEMAIRVARTVDYVNAGTVEFLVDANGEVFFMEMNTRLQVEHPVTEMVTGIDIVKEQLRTASGRKLRYAQEDVQIRGWAMECRIQAEDPYNDFLPSVGRVTSLYEPTGPGVRVESGIYEGFEVSLYYDPLIAKLVVWGETRGETILRMRRALKEYRIMGIKTTIPFYEQLLNSTRFIGGQFDTTFVENRFTPAEEEKEHHKEAAVIVAALLAHRDRQRTVVRVASQHTSNWKRQGLLEAMSR